MVLRSDVPKALKVFGPTTGGGTSHGLLVEEHLNIMEVQYIPGTGTLFNIHVD